MCVELASKEPSHLEMYGITTSKFVAATTDTNLKTSQENTKGINDGMNCLLVMYPGLKIKEIFSHIVVVYLTNDKTILPSKFLDISVSTSNRNIRKDRADTYTIKWKIIKDDGGPNTVMELAARKLDHTVYIKLHLGIVN